MKLPWMSRSDRRNWRTARTMTDLGELMARWLEGDIDSRIGYQPRYGPDAETEQLVPTLAALCRAGYVTTQSQPGVTGTGADGLWWEMRAALQLVLTDPALLHRLTEAASTAGMVVRVNDHRHDGTGVQDEAIVVTTRDGEPWTAFGGQFSRADMDLQWRGLHRDLYDQVAHGTYVSIAAPQYGPIGDRLWNVLDHLTGLRVIPGAGPWS